MNIRFDGEVSICCEDSLVQYSLGNINDQTISEIWYGEKMINATRLLDRGLRKEIKPCSRCTKGVCPVKVAV
jgi:radical SAM protein with 4Fe4S-binding SPASM domain